MSARKTPQRTTSSKPAPAEARMRPMFSSVRRVSSSIEAGVVVAVDQRALARDVEEAAFGDDPGAVGAGRRGSLNGRSRHAGHRRRCAPPLRESTSRSATRRAHDPRRPLPGAWPRHPHRSSRRRRSLGRRRRAGRRLRADARRPGSACARPPARASGSIRSRCLRRSCRQADLHRPQLPPARRGDRRRRFRASPCVFCKLPELLLAARAMRSCCRRTSRTPTTRPRWPS